MIAYRNLETQELVAVERITNHDVFFNKQTTTALWTMELSLFREQYTKVGEVVIAKTEKKEEDDFEDMFK